jgi:hypothetical protein
MAHRAWRYLDAMRSMLVVLLAVAPAYAEAPRPRPQPKPDSKAAPAAQAAPDAAAQAAPDAAAQAGPADPAPKGQPWTLPRATSQDVMPGTQQTPGQVTGGLSFGGGFAAGAVIVPPPHPDDQPWPRGIRIEPPEVNDSMAILPGTDQRAPAQPAAAPSWSKQIADAVHDGIGTVVGLLLPKAL